VRKSLLSVSLVVMLIGLAATPRTQAQVKLLAVGSLTSSSAGSFADLSGLHNTLENGASANLLGGLGSGLAYASGNTFLALPDRGPNAVPFDSLVDDTVTYIPRFHTITMDLKPNNGTGLPFTITPTLRNTTLLFSLTPLVYGTGENLAIGSGVPPQNNFLQHFFTGRSDAFDPNRNSGNPNDARLDSEGIRLSNDGLRVYISDEYGPYVYEFDRLFGVRLRSFKLPSHLFVSNLSSMGAVEISDNTSGRTANKGMEGLAITPDGRTLVGMMQNALIQDAAAAPSLLRFVTIDIASGQTTHEYAYLLTNGTGVSEITALNQHEFLVDERDGHGRGDGSKAKVKQIFKIDLNGAVDVTNMDGATAATHAVTKSAKPFLDIVTVLVANGIAADQIPAKLEGIAIGPDVKQGKTTLHTLWVANDNDFLTEVPDDNGVTVPNPNQFFVFGFTDTDLAGSKLVPQQFRSFFF
jgi:hypothetical protein